MGVQAPLRKIKGIIITMESWATWTTLFETDAIKRPIPALEKV